MDLLIPIHIDIEQGGFRVRDTFLWDASPSASSVDMRTFAEWYCEDQQPPLPLIPFRDLVAQSVQEQVRQRAHVADVVNRNNLLQWYIEKKRAQRRREAQEEAEAELRESGETDRTTNGDTAGVEMEESGGQSNGSQVDPEEDWLITIELDNVRHKDLVLKDKFQWDLRSMANVVKTAAAAAMSGDSGNGNHTPVPAAITPELFAEHVVKDTRLDPHFVPLIACHLREQLWQFWEQQVADFELEQRDPLEYQRLVQQRLQKIEQAKRQIIHEQQIAQQQQQLMEFHGHEGPLTGPIQRRFLFNRLFNPMTRSVTKTSYRWTPRLTNSSSYLDYAHHTSMDDWSDDDDDDDDDVEDGEDEDYDGSGIGMEDDGAGDQVGHMATGELHGLDELVDQNQAIKSGLVRADHERDMWYPSLMRISQEDVQRLEQMESQNRRRR